MSATDRCANGEDRLHEAILPFSFAHKRPKPRTGLTPTAVDDEFELVIICTCENEHEPLTIEMTSRGVLANVTGNALCWFGLFEFLTAHLADKPQSKLLQRWNQGSGSVYRVGEQALGISNCASAVYVLNSNGLLASAPWLECSETGVRNR